MKLSIDLPSGFLDYEAKTMIVSPTRKKVWAVALDLLSQLDRVCRKHGIRYFCDGGTLLGAVRHRGFVPWDDDLDVIMTRTEYEKLCAVAPKELEYPYFWQTNETDPGSARGHAQLRNSETTGILRSEMRDGRPMYSFNQGIFIDIFPFDNVPDDGDERELFLSELCAMRERISQAMNDRLIVADLRKHFSLRRWIHIRDAVRRVKHDERYGVSSLDVACREMDALAKKYRDVKTREVSPVSFMPRHREVLPAAFFEEVEYLDFEFLKIPVLSHYREVLEINYGHNWRDHIIGSAAHGGMFIDVERPYTEYLKGV